MSYKFLLVSSLVIISLWWIFWVVWQPVTMHTVAKVSNFISPTSVPTETSLLARERAFLYATRGGSATADIYFSKDEVSHLIDVSHLYRPISLGLNIFATLSWSVLILAAAKRENLTRVFLLSAKILIGMLFFSCVCLVLFPLFFELFHTLLFPQGNWAFPPDSLLIQLFPEIFWKLMLSAMASMLAIFAAVYWLFWKLGETHA